MTTRGNVDAAQLRTSSRKGVGAQVQMFGGGATQTGHVAVYNGAGDLIDGGPAGGGGTVTSVALQMPSEFVVAGSPITGSGTFAVSKAAQGPNLVYASPSSGSGAPTFRALTAADIPAGVGAVASVFGRTGAVVAQTGDYTAAKVTNAVDTTQTYANPAWITSLDYSKITNAPAGGSQTPWLQDENAANYKLYSLGNLFLGNNGSVLPVVDSSHQFVLGENIAAGQIGRLTFAVNATTVGAVMGVIAGANFASAQTDKRFAQIRFVLDTTQEKGGMDFQSGSTGAGFTTRMKIDSAGHIVINQPDAGGITSGLQMLWSGSGSSPDNILETALWSGLTCNMYLSAGAWYARSAGQGCIVRADSNRGFGVWAAANAAAGAAMTFIKAIDIVSGGASTYYASTSLVFQTGASSTTRLTIDSGGNFTFSQNDGGNGSYLVSPGMFNIVSTTDLLVNSAATVQMNSGASRKLRLNISATGIISTGIPDTANATFGVQTNTPNGIFAVNCNPNFTTAASAKHIWLGEQSNNAGYGLQLGYYAAAGVWRSLIQSKVNSAGSDLMVNPLGGNVGIGIAEGTAPAARLDIVSNDNTDSGNALVIRALNLTQSASYSFGGITSTYFFKIQSATNQYLLLNPGGGNVGVGGITLPPPFPLCVQGQIRVEAAGSAIRLSNGNSPTVMLYQDGANFYFLLTNANDPNGAFNGLRPLSFSQSTGAVIMSNGLTASIIDVPAINASANRHITFGAGAYTQLMFRTWLWTPTLGDATNANSLPGGYITFESNGSTQVYLKLRGGDNVIRSFTMNLA